MSEFTDDTIESLTEFLDALNVAQLREVRDLVSNFLTKKRSDVPASMGDVMKDVVRDREEKLAALRMEFKKDDKVWFAHGGKIYHGTIRWCNGKTANVLAKPEEGFSLRPWRVSYGSLHLDT